MKKVLTVILFFSLIPSVSFAQCKRFVKKMDVSTMKNYDYCNTSQVAKMYKGDHVTLQYPVQSNKRYRIASVSEEHLGAVKLTIQNNNGEPLGLASKDSNRIYWDIMVENDQVIQVQLAVEEANAQTEINTAACVAVLFGSMELEELVLNQ